MRINCYFFTAFCLSVLTCFSAISQPTSRVDLNLEPSSPSAEINTEIIIELVLASVDATPITLTDLATKAKIPASALNLERVKADPKLQNLLEQMIAERLLEAEAERRKIKISVNDVERYIDQVAKQNNLSRAEFESALQQQGQDITTFSEQSRKEVIRSKIMSQLAQSAPAVTEEELESPEDEDSDSEETGSVSEEGIRYQLREIFIPLGPQFSSKVVEVSEALEQGTDFATLAATSSAGPTANNGGDMGLVYEKDLSEQIVEAIADLDEGQASGAVEFEDGIRFFFVSARYEDGHQVDRKEEAKESVRKELESRKLAKHFEDFFEKEIYRFHKIERKI
jgi:peptidyl-prolyl cis-trans isomerase SurA